jgi:hypothetical protein
MPQRRFLFLLSLISLISLSASAQSVIAVRSGVVHFFEGSVFIDDQPLEPIFGTFPMIKEGSRLWTGDGRVEVLLTPGVFLRLDENSSIRMVTNSLSDTRVEFLRGSIILDSTDANAGDSVVLMYKDWQVRFPGHGVYRIDTDPAAVLQAYSGEAQVTQGGKPSKIDASHLFFFSPGTETNKYDEGADDDFYQWAEDRSQAIAKDNQLSAQTSRDPADLDNGQTLPAVPGLGLGTPSYGAPLGAPLGVVPLGGSLINPYYYSALGGPVGIYSVFPLYIPRYYRTSVSVNRPVRTVWRPGTTRPPGAVWPFGTAYRHYPTYTPHPLPVTPRPVPIGVGAARPAPGAHIAIPAHPIGHK